MASPYETFIYEYEIGLIMTNLYKTNIHEYDTGSIMANLNETDYVLACLAMLAPAVVHIPSSYLIMPLWAYFTIFWHFMSSRAVAIYMHHRPSIFNMTKAAYFSYIGIFFETHSVCR